MFLNNEVQVVQGGDFFIPLGETATTDGFHLVLLSPDKKIDYRANDTQQDDSQRPGPFSPALDYFPAGKVYQAEDHQSNLDNTDGNDKREYLVDVFQTVQVVTSS